MSTTERTLRKSSISWRPSKDCKTSRKSCKSNYYKKNEKTLRKTDIEPTLNLINDVKNYVEYLEKGEEVKRPSIGISVINVSDKYSLFRSGFDYNTKETSGVVIAQTVSGASADKSGLKVGDIIKKFDDKDITNISTLRYYLYQYKTGDTIKVTYIRNGKTQTLDMKLIEK